MSKIIKKTDLVISSPKIVRAFSELEREVEEVQRADIDTVMPSNLLHIASEADLLEEKRRELALIKEESAQILTETEDLVKDLMERARDEARGIISQAEEEADVIRQQARKDADKLQKDTQEKSYREGLKKANEAIEADRQMAIEQSQQMVEEAQRMKFAIMQSTETDMVRLIMAISKKVIVHELKTRPDLIVDIVRQAVSNLDKPEQLRIYVNPEEVKILVDTLAQERLVVEGNRDVPVVVKADNSVSAGGCIVESGGASVDATTETRIHKVEEALLDIPGSEQ